MTKDDPQAGGLAQPKAPAPKTDEFDPPNQGLDLADLDFSVLTEDKALERLSPTERIVLDEIPSS